MAAINFLQNIVRVVYLEIVQGGPLNTLIPNTCLQQPMWGGLQNWGFAPLGTQSSLGEQFLRFSRNYLSWFNRVLSFLPWEKSCVFSDILIKEY